MLRFAIFVLLLYFAWRAVKNLLLPPMDRRPGQGRGPEQIDDVMVKDPQCEVYIPMRQAVSARVRGEIVHFCSTECRDRYLGNL